MKASEILFWTSIIIVIVPLLSQWFIGRELLKKNKLAAFDWFYGINIFLQFVVTGLSYVIQGESFYYKANENGWGEPPFNMPPPVIGLPISFIVGIVLLITGYNQMRKIKPNK